MKTLKRCIDTCRSSFSPWLVWASLTLFVAPVWADTGPSVLGGLKRELYTNVPGLSVAELTNHAKFPDTPDLVDIVSSFETLSQQGDNYGQRLTGYIIPPLTGAYVFYLASDDQGILFLSPDDSPARRQPIAWESEWNMPRQWSNPQPPHPPVTTISPPIQLEAGRRYYVEALHKEGGGGDNFGVAWQIPGGPVPETGSPPIAGEFLATPGANEPPIERELHLVGVYSGNVDGHSSRTNEEGVAKVSVNRPGKRVTLLLGAYEPVLWSLTVSPETIIEKVILTGYYPKRIEGLAPGVPVIAAWSGEGGSSSYLSFGYSSQSCEFYRALPKVIGMTGMQVSSFHGAYTAPVEPFVIDAVQDDPRLSPDYPQPANLAELPSLQFQAAFYTGSSSGSTGEIYRKSYTLAGAVGGGSLLPDLRVVPDSSQRYFYAAKSHEVMRVDAQTGFAEGMQVTAGEVSWPMGMAYDSLRDRVLLVTLGGEGFLYAYYPQSGQWSLVRSMNNLDVGNLVYHAAQDALYAVGQNWGNYGPWRLYRLTPDGAQQGEIALPQVCLTGAEYGITSELVSVGDYLVLLVGPENRSYYSDPAETRMYLIDPRSGQVWLTSRQRDLNQCPTIEITGPAQNSIFAVGKPITIAARANDAEHHIQTVDFYSNGQKLGEIRGNNFSYSFEWTNAPIGTYSLTAVALDSSWCSVTSAPVHISVTQGNTAPVVNCPPPQSVTATTETGLAAYVPLTASVSDPDYGPLQAVWYVDGNPVATNNLPTDPSHPRTATYSAIFMLGLHSVKVVASDFIAPPTFCTTTVEVTSPVAKVLPARDDQQSPRVASDGTNFFVVWLDRRNKPHGDWTECDVYGARVSSGGYVLDRNGILIAPGSMWASPPAVGFDGTNYLVVWQDNRNSEMGPIRGARVSRAGVVLDGPNGFRIGEDTGLLQSNPSLAFDGRLWFVAWNDWRNQTNGIPENLICDVYGARITTKGEVLDIANVPVVRAPWWQSCPAVGSLGHDFLVIWQDMDGLRGARVTDSGAVSATFLVSHGRVGSIGQPALGRLGTNYLAAWDETFNNGNNVVYSWVVGTRLNPSGTPLDGDGFLIRTNQTRSSGVAVAGWQLQSIVAWHESAFDGTDKVWGAHVNAAGMVYPPNRLTQYSSAQTQPTLAWNNRALFAAWHDMRNATNANVNWPWGDVYGTIIDFAYKLDPPVVFPVDFLISSETLNPPIVRWAHPAPITYGTFLGPAQLNATSSVPGSFVYTPPAGTLLHAGQAQRLSVVFTPLDPTRYVRVTNTVSIDVLPASLTIKADDKARYAGTPNPPLTATYSGFVENDSPAVLDTPVTLTTTATIDSPPGEYPIIASGAADADYLIGFGNGVLLVVPMPDSFVKRTIAGFSVQLAANPPAGTLVWAVEELPPVSWAVLDISHDGVWDKTTGKVKFGPFFDASPRTLTYRVLPPLGFVGVGLFSGQASADGVSTAVTGDDRIVIPTQHPADRTPSNWKLTMDEATGYAAAWRSGETWPVPPNPVPVDYVTRASALWRGGEAYRLDPSIEGPPLWWVNTEIVPLRQGGDPQPFGAIRHMPPAYVPGEPLNCAIEVATMPMCRAYAVEEKVPVGWQVRSPSDAGQMDTVNGVLKWGPFYDAAPRTLRYTLMPPLTATATVDLTGTASFDGLAARTTGCDQLPPGSKLNWGRRDGQPGWALQLKGPIGARYVVERSADLTSWTSVMTVTNQLGAVDLPDIQPAGGNSYYRARIVNGN